METTTHKLTCLVTIHGMGFQHAPINGGQGYADGLNQFLQAVLPELSGDPRGEFGRPPGVGAVYVHSDWPPGSGKMDEGLKRLGQWAPGDADHRQLDVTGVPLAEPDRAIAHVALVYAGLEEEQPHLGASLETLAKAIIASHNYAGIPSLVGMGVTDVWAALSHRLHGGNAPTPSLQVRGRIAVPAAAQPADSSGGLFAAVQQLDSDVTTYVCRNDLRERVRGFVHEAILRICCRDDVDTVVVNAHSLGTVLAFDVVRQLPPFAAAKVQALVTAGSPLRKFVDLFYWGTDCSCIATIPWTNFWDKTDPVADPLVPERSWRRGTPLPVAAGTSMLYAGIDQDTGVPRPVAMLDVEVDNAGHGAGGGLPAHNYWDNREQFVIALARIVGGAAGSVP